MAGNPNYSSLISSTLDKFMKESVTSSVIGNNALLKALQNKGRIMHESGGRNFQENIAYASNSTVQFQNPTDLLNTTPQDEFTSAIFAQKMLTGTDQISEKELLQNAGEARIFNLLEGKRKNLMDSLRNQLGSALFSDGTGSGGLEIGGLQLLVADDPTTGTVGGIDRSTNAFWRNQVYDFSTSAGGNASASNIQAGMNSLYLACQVQEGSYPDLILADINYYSFFENSLQQIQRITTTGEGKLGFEQLAYKSSAVVYDPNCPSNHMYFLNTDYVKFQHLNNPLFTRGETQRPVNQLYYVTPVYLYGNLTISSARVHGVAKN
ncbi:MAG: phage major capsid protein [Sediminibacterium sp.]